MSNLTISYASQTAAGIAPAGAPAADAPAADSPLGFLAALIDQLLAGGAPATTETASAETGAEVSVAGLLDVALDPAPAETDDADPLAGLANQLDALQAQIAGGEKPSPEQLQTLTATIDALSVAPPSAQLPNAPTITDLRDRLVSLSQSIAATAPALSQQLETLSAKLVANLPEPKPASSSDDATTIAQVIRALLGDAPSSDDVDAPTDKSTPGDELLQILAALGISAAPSTTTPASSITDSSAVPPDLVRLSTQLSKLSTELAPTDPELAQKLDAVATKLMSADADPKLRAQLTSAASDTDRTVLDKLVQSLIDTKPVPTPLPAAPRIAATAQLQIPAPIAPKQSQSAVTEVKAAPPQPAPVTADLAPAPVKIAVEQVAAKTPEPEMEQKAEAAIQPKADAAKPDATPPSTQAATAPAIIAAPARPLPAAYQPATNPINMGQVAFEMVRQVQQGHSRFTIRLDPPEMGRVDVRMHIDPSGAVNARLIVDRAETLDMFQRDQRSLERALAQAGLDSSKTNLEFSLRQSPFAGMTGGDQRQQQQNSGAAPRFSLSQSDEQPMPAITLYRGIASAGGVNIFA